MDDPRFGAGLLDMSDAARFLGIPRATFRRWAQGYARGGPLLHIVEAGPRQAQVSFVAMAEAHVLEALRQAGVRPARIRPALNRLAAEFGREYVLVARNLATDGIDVLWDFSRTRRPGPYGRGDRPDGHAGDLRGLPAVPDMG